LLYLIDLHSRKAENRNEKDIWIRKQALSVIVYEGVVADVFDYDYAPTSILINNKRVWCNISQEGQSDIEFLREEELVNALLLSSRSYKPGVCYQISEKGKELVRYISRREKESVDLFAHKEGTRELLKPYWDGHSYWMQAPSGFHRKSSVTETEAVSYVSSAYIPQCLRYGGRPTMSNAHKAHSSGFGAIDTIRDQELDEVITLDSVSLIVAEYIPFGSNQIVQLNNTIGSSERVQGGYISSILDERSCETTVEMTPELTSVNILDYTLTNHINFEAEIRFPEDPGVVQVETFGVSLNAEGTCFYGMQIEAVMEKVKDKISLDHLSRILVDVQQDSSQIVDSVISHRQRNLLNQIFYGDMANRNKINLIIANQIHPHLTAEEYMDKGEFENELKQIIGDTKAAYDISEKDTLVFGAHGLLLCGPHARSHEPLLCAYMQFVTLDIFLQNYFARMWILNEDMERTEKIIDCIVVDPTALYNAREKLNKLCKDTISLEEILGYVMEALQIMEIPPEPQEQAGRSLYQRLEIFSMRSQLMRRTVDMKKNTEGSTRYLAMLQQRVDTAAEVKVEQLNKTLEKNGKALEAIRESQEETIPALAFFKVILSGVITFNLLDRITGDWTVMDITWMKSFVNNIVRGNYMIWFFISIVAWGIVTVAVIKITKNMTWYDRGMTEVKISMKEKIHSEKLRLLLAIKSNISEERHYEESREIITVTYDEPNPQSWGRSPPTISLEFDEKNQFMLQIVIRYNSRKAKKDEVLSIAQVKERVLSGLIHQRIFLNKADDVKGK
jgi:WD repeat-containing protein 35